MALPSGCRTVCRPNRRVIRLWSSRDAVRIALKAAEVEGYRAVCVAVNEGLRCSETQGECQPELIDKLRKVRSALNALLFAVQKLRARIPDKVPGLPP